MTQFVERDGIRIHYQIHRQASDHSQPPAILIHGLTANAHCFDGVIAAGLSQHRASIAVDLRGRGLSDKPSSGYSPAEHAADIIAVLDRQHITQTVICGHSYGALIALELATQYPDRVSRIALLDIGGTSIKSPHVLALIQSSLDRLGKIMPSMAEFLAAMRTMPFLNGFWDDCIEQFYRADVETQPDGTVKVRTPPGIIELVTQAGQTIDWNARFAAAAKPTLLVHASGGYGPPSTPPLILENQAREAAALLPHAKFVQVPGNHMTMLFGEHATALVAELAAFMKA